MDLLAILLVVALVLTLALHSAGRLSRLAWEIMVTLVLVLLLLGTGL
jgi:hypothetical protein